MAEPPAKRARRTDSSAMWDMNERSSRPGSRGGEHVDGPLKRDIPGKEDFKRSNPPREDRRPRSRSRDRDDRRRDRSRSRDRKSRRSSRDGRRGGGRGERERERSMSRDRGHSRRDFYSRPGSYRDRGRDPSRSRTRSRSPGRNGAPVRARSPPRGPKADRKDAPRSQQKQEPKKAVNGTSESKRDAMEINSTVDGDEDEMDQLMRKTMGFSTFRTTQNTKIPGNNIYGVRKEKKTEYRQYMNRSGGFNRPLSPSR
ncbi:hypothetical protein AJ80_04906 [Polytolypa hystricis UAMH7299]|uniref:U4/U6.U5 small nuclear ribonucleoprotein 27kDa protein domain-containing protein n=1 Tax=Polytolypa hystricis (strain UAMH7299) TaxID=1447883 RepID=A0A2B7XZN1_POLH7|nr:hypothetical protein AJ80_04906 [Polytolypa hystricis UAMH7299]